MQVLITAPLPSPQVHARDLELHRRQAQLDALATKLEEVEERRTFESRIAATDGRTLKAEVVRLEQALDTARLEHGRLEKEKQKLIVQCVNHSRTSRPMQVLQHARAHHGAPPFPTGA